MPDSLTPNRDAVDRLIAQRDADPALAAVTEPFRAAQRDITTGALNPIHRYMADTMDRGEDPEIALVAVAQGLGNAIASLTATFGDGEERWAKRFAETVGACALRNLRADDHMFAHTELADNTAGVA